VGDAVFTNLSRLTTQWEEVANAALLVLEKEAVRRLDWVIVGGESGPIARFCDPARVMDIRDQCLHSGVAFFFKQWVEVQKKRTTSACNSVQWSTAPVATLAMLAI